MRRKDREVTRHGDLMEMVARSNSFPGGVCRDKKTHERHYAESRVKVKSDLVQLRIMFRLDSFPRLGEL